MGNEGPVIYIPCKMSSHGVKLKNLRLLGGVPLVRSEERRVGKEC